MTQRTLTAVHHILAVPPMPTAGHGAGDLSLWISAPALVGLIVLAVWIRRR